MGKYSGMEPLNDSNGVATIDWCWDCDGTEDTCNTCDWTDFDDKDCENCEGKCDANENGDTGAL